jgi:hypothetical protein
MHKNNSQKRSYNRGKSTKSETNLEVSRSAVGAAIHAKRSLLRRGHHPSEAGRVTAGEPRVRGSSRTDAGPHPRKARAHRGGAAAAAGWKEEAPPTWGEAAATAGEGGGAAAGATLRLCLRSERGCLLLMKKKETT